MDSLELLSLFLSLVSILVAVYAAIIANKPFFKRIVLSESFCSEINCYKFSVSNIGREVVFPKYIKIIDIRTSKVIGFYSFEEKGNKLYAIAPGEVRYIKVSFDEKMNYKHEVNVNQYLRVLWCDIYGKRKVFKNIFAVG